MKTVQGPVTMIVPYVPGGGSDQRARLVARHLAGHLDCAVDVVNRTGAVVGHSAIATAVPDGRTIGLITGEIGMMHWHRGLTGLTWRDYTALAVPFVEAAAIIVDAASPWRGLEEFIVHARDAAIIGSGGPHFGVWKFALAGLLDRAGIGCQRLHWIETHSGEQGLENVLGGKADVAPITMTDARGALRAGRARALATMEVVRHRNFPDVPTVQEAIGIPWTVAHWRGFVAPAGLPPAVRQEFLDAFHAIAADAVFGEEAAATAFTVQWREGDAFAEYMAEDDALFGHIIGLLGPEAAGEFKVV